MWRKKVEWEPYFQSEVVDWPSGTCVRTDESAYFIKGKAKFRIPTEKVLRSWAFKSIGWCSVGSLAGYKNAGVLGFRDGTLIHDISSGRMYLISESKRRHIVDPDAFDKYGLNRGTMIEVSLEEANLHNDGEVLK